MKKSEVDRILGHEADGESLRLPSASTSTQGTPYGCLYKGDNGVLPRVGATALEVLFGAPHKGTIKSLEGMYDATAGLVGAIGGIFNEDFKDNVGEHIAFDATDWLSKSIGYDKIEELSYLNDGKVGNFVRDAETAIGGMAPSVALSAIPYAGAVLGPVSMGMAAGGNNMEAALNKGAGYYGSWAYGIGTGLVEGATEAIGGFAFSKGGTLASKILAGTKLGKYASKGIGKVAEGFISEGVEEVLADVADPALQYVTGVDKNIGENYKETAKNLPRTFLLGGTVGTLMGGGSAAISGVRNSSRGGFKATRADTALEYISEVSKNYGNDVNKNARYDKAINGALMDISRELTSMSKEQRTNYLSSMGVYKNAFNEDGSIKQDLDKADYNEEAVSRRIKPIVSLYEGKHAPIRSSVEVSDGASQAKTHIERAVGAQASVIITNDDIGTEAYFDPDSNAFYINNDSATLKSAEDAIKKAALRTSIHEMAHSAEGTKEYLKLQKEAFRIAKDERAPAHVKESINRAMERIGEIGADYADQLKNMNKAQAYYTRSTEATSMMLGELLGEQYVIDTLAERNEPLVKQLINRFKGTIKKSATVDSESVKYLRKLVNRFEKALDNAHGGVKISQIGVDEKDREGEVENVRFSKKTVPGTNEKFVVIEKASIEKLMSFPGETLPAKVRNYLKQFRGTVLPLGSTDRAYMRREAEGEYTNPAKVVSETDYEGKLNAASEFENLLESAQFVDHQPDNGRHPDATRGWNYYELKYVVPTNDGVRAYKGQIQIKLIERGDCFYDITKIEDITNGAAGQALIKAAGSADISSNKSIYENGEKSNTFDKKIDDERKSISKNIDFEEVDGGVKVSIPNPIIENTKRKAAADAERAASAESLLNEKKEPEVTTEFDEPEMSNEERQRMADEEREESGRDFYGRKSGYTNKRKVKDLINEAIDSSGILDGIGEDVAFIGKDAQKKIIGTIFSRVNASYEYNKKSFADYAARRILESVVLGDGQVYKANARLKGMMHKIDISSVEEKISKRDKLKITSRWKLREGENAISISDAVKDLNDLGYQIPMTDELDMINEINLVYENTRKYIEDEMGEELSERMGKDEYEKAKKKLADDILSILVENQTENELASKLAGVINKHQKTLDRFRDYKKAFRVDENRVRAEMAIIHHARQIKTDIKNHTYTPAQQPRFNEFKGIIAKIAKLEVRGNINRSSAKDIIADLTLWYTKENELLVDAFNEDIREDITYFRDSESKEKLLSITELYKLSGILAHLKNVFVNFGKIYRAGKWVELSEVSKKMYNMCLETLESNTGFSGILRRGAYFESPLAVAAIWDGHDPNGEFTRYVEDLQRGQLNVSVEKMKIAEKIDEFFKKDRKLFNNLVSGKLKVKCGIKVDLRSETAITDIEIPAVNLINLYLCTRTMSPEDFTLEKVGYAVKVDNSGKYQYMAPISREEIKKAYEALPAPIKELTEWVQNWNNTEGKKMKYEQDIRVNGVSNVISGDYWHLKRLHFEGINDMEKLFGARGVSHGFNKERIKQASSMLIIDNFIEAFLNHTEELFQYKYIDITIKNFDKIVQANVDESANGNERYKSVKMLIDGEQFYHGTVDKDSTALSYMTQLWKDVLKQNDRNDPFNVIVGNMRAGYASFVLGANVKVWATQFSSLIAGFGELRADSVLYGAANILRIFNPKSIAKLAQEVDEHCDWARVRHFEKGATKAMTLTDKIGKWRGIFTKPIELFDRFIVMLEYKACQNEAQKRFGLKIGTEENKIKAGELLTEVGLKTQQNQYESTKSAAIRSQNEIMKGLVMFKTDSHMVLSGLIKELSALSILNKKIKLAKQSDDTAKIAELEKQMKQARKKTAKYATVVMLSCAYMTLLARLFNRFYEQDEDDEMTVGDICLDLFGNFLGMFPIISEIGSFLIDGYDVDNSVYSSVNNALGAVDKTIDLFKKAISGKEITSEEAASTLRNDIYAIGQIFGVPAKNLYKNTKWVIGWFAPNAEDKMDAWFKAPSQSELEDKLTEEIKKGDERAVKSALDLLYSKYDVELKDAVLRGEYDRLMTIELTKGEDDKVKYTPLEAKIPSNLEIDGEDVELTRKDVNAFKNALISCESAQARVVKTANYKRLGNEERAYALRKINQYYFESTKYTYTGEKSSFAYYAKLVGVEQLALIMAYAKNLKGDEADSLFKKAQTRREKIEAYIKALGLNTVKTSLALRALGYGDKENDALVTSYVGRASALTKEERAEMLEILR